MEYETIKIGEIYNSYGRDDYYLIKNNEDDIDIDHLRDWLYKNYSYENRLYFCEYQSILIKYNISNEVVVIIHHSTTN